jgi:hypothetical protein
VGFSFKITRGQCALLLSIMACLSTAQSAGSKYSFISGMETCSLKSGSDAATAPQQHSDVLPARDSYPAGVAPMVHYAADAGNLRHWEKPIVAVYIDSDCPETAHRDVLPQLARGMEMWNRKMDNVIKLAVTRNPADADIEVTFVKPGSLAGKAIGRTDVTFRLTDQVLVHAKVSINEGLANDQLIQVAAHEMGHALGIQGHSPAHADLMYPYAHLPAKITVRDQNTMNLSYGKPLCPNCTDTDGDGQGDACVDPKAAPASR